MKEKKETKQSLSSILYNVLIRETLFPLFLMITTPNLVMFLQHIVINKNSNLKNTLLSESLRSTLTQAWNSVKWFVIIKYFLRSYKRLT